MLMVAIIIFIVILIIWMTGKYQLSEITRAKKICTIYRTILEQNKSMTKEENLEVTAFIYFKSLKWDAGKVEIKLKTLFDYTKPNNIKELIEAIFVYENPDKIDLRSEEIYDVIDKTDKTIHKACKDVLGNFEEYLNLNK